MAGIRWQVFADSFSGLSGLEKVYCHSLQYVDAC